MADDSPRAAARLLQLLPSSLVIGIFFVIPFALILLASVGHQADGDYSYGFEFTHYARFFDWFYIQRALFSAGIAMLIAVICLVIAFPFTYFLTRFSERARTLWLIYILAQLSLSEVLIAFSWQVLFSKTGGLANVLVWLGVIGESFAMAPTIGAVITALVYLAMPFAVLLTPSSGRRRSD